MTTTSRRIAGRFADLARQRRRFVRATVVRAQCPTSARPGDAAAVLPDGTIEGFVGGHCAESSVRTAALGVFERGESVLLRILPDDAESFPDAPGAVTVVNPCLSGGALEIFLELSAPAPALWLVGTTPIVDALRAMGPDLGFDVAGPANAADDRGPAGATAAIVASHGRGEEEAIRAALDAGVGWIGLVASRRRAAAVLDALDLSDEERSRVEAPAGIDIGATTAEEIALSILAGVVREIRVNGLTAPSLEAPPLPATAVDPVCGMTVTVLADTPHLHHDGTDHWFCNEGCRQHFADQLGADQLGLSL